MENAPKVLVHQVQKLCLEVHEVHFSFFKVGLPLLLCVHGFVGRLGCGCTMMRSRTLTYVICRPQNSSFDAYSSSQEEFLPDRGVAGPAGHWGAWLGSQTGCWVNPGPGWGIRVPGAGSPPPPPPGSQKAPLPVGHPKYCR